jgi:hypothetical protein
MTLAPTFIALAATAALGAHTPFDSAASRPRSWQAADHAMGFDQARTTHHFRITADGGTIEVTAKNPNDKTSIDQIRMHLRHIATAFADGDFSLPMLVHAAEPPGVPVMKDRRRTLAFSYAEIDAGGKVVIRTADAAAREALHDFLRFQIREHKTGDPTDAK